MAAEYRHKSQFQSQSQYQGFSILELLIVFTVAAILLLVAVPSFVSYLQTNTLISTTQRLYYTLQYARSEAIKRNTTIYVPFVTGANWCYGIHPGATCSCSTAGSCTLGAVSAPTTSSQSTTLSLTTLTSPVTFNGTHGATYAKGTINFALGGNTLSIKVTALGNLQICSSTVAGYPACT